MTIKKRLARSNIAMLVIPLLTAAVLLLLGLGAALLLLRENMPSVHTVAYPSGSARDGGGIHTADGDGAGLRLVKPQQQLEHRAFPGARPAHQRHLLALPYGHGEVVENGSFAVAEGHMG